MTELLNPIFNDPLVQLTDEMISSIVGDKMKLWNDILKHANDNYKDVFGTWNYYRDGKQWLFKFVQKKKTLFRAGIFEGRFRITFYFGDKAESVVLSGDIPDDIKEGFRSARRFGSIRPISIVLSEQSDVENVYKLIYLKSKIK